MAKKQDPTRAYAFTGKCIALYPHLAEKDTRFKAHGEYKLDVLYDLTSEDAKKLQAEAQRLAQLNFGTLDNVKLPIKKAPATKCEKYPVYKDRLFATLSTTQDVKVFNHQGTAISGSEIRSGNYVNCSVTLAAMDTTFGKVVKAYLNGVQKLGEGEDLGLGTGCPFEPTEEIVTPSTNSSSSLSGTSVEEDSLPEINW